MAAPRKKPGPKARRAKKVKTEEAAPEVEMTEEKVEDEPKVVQAPPEKPKNPFPSLTDLEEMPLRTHQDYINYNDAVRTRRRHLRKKDVDYMYAPMDIVKKVKVRLTRTSNQNLPININIRDLDTAIWFKSPDGGFKHGDIVELPAMIIDRINSLAEPKYKQEKYPDGTHATVLDYWDNKYSCQYIGAADG